VDSELNDNEFAEEFPDLPEDGISRRRFMSLVSASAALAFGASCSKIDRGTIVPYTKRPDEIIPGVEDYYASTFQEGLVTYGVLVKTREGRPIHVEGNAEHLFSKGKTSLRSIGDLLGLYDPDRLRAPSFKGAPASWEDAEKAFSHALSDARIMDKPILLLTNAIVSPAQKALLYDLKLALPSLRHAAWEPNLSHSQILASRMLFGESALPRFHFDRAQLILSLQSDFLGTDSAAAAYAQSFSTNRSPSNSSESMSRLWVVEGGMTLTGANADQRVQLYPWQMPVLAFILMRLLNESHSIPLPEGMTADDLKEFEPEGMSTAIRLNPSVVRRLAEDLVKAGRFSLVLAGDAVPPETHMACTLLNRMMGAEGNTVEMSTTPSSPGLLTYAELENLLKEADQGKFAIGIFWGTNPAYSFPNAALWKQAVLKIPETYRIGLYEDETALDCLWRLPEHHWLESWGDFESASDFVGLRQPTVGAIHKTRQIEDLLLYGLRQMKMPAARNYLEYVKNRWQADVFPIGSPASFEAFWNASLHDGGAKRERKSGLPLVMNMDAVKNAISTASKPPTANGVGKADLSDSMEVDLVLFPGAGVFDGRYANNGWLNELPDPVTKATWGNPVLISASDAEYFGSMRPFQGGYDLKEQDVIEIVTAAGKIEAPVIIQPGQKPGVASIALGYGRRTGAVATGIGANAYRLIDSSSKSPFLIQKARIRRKETGARHPIPKTQMYNRMEGRDLARSWTLAEYSQNSKQRKEREYASLIPDQKFSGHKWGMVVDLSACVGCSACVIACQSENNIPVVGPERVLERREMHWIRIDRYYAGDLRDPKVLHQPMFCQHCDNAPCEIVCPVNATVHSPDGLNQMAYNRCVGTRYCSNNCPFKVRRFNFFDYTSMKKEPENLAFNPEVTVRPRGVMEKCTLCIQRIQNEIQKAKVEKRQIVDGEIQPACVAACPSGALVFGDLNNTESRVAKLSRSDRNYRVLEELGIKPSMSYLADISNPAMQKG
jgi:Fe-S-cluster-containing dehydrogenase component/anaerobic selenocysteine-containing dehydrogenase